MNIILICYTNNFSYGRIHFGLAQISSILKDNGYKVNLVYIKEGEIISKKVKEILLYEPDFIAMSASTNHYDFVKDISTQIKMIYNIPFFVGGSLPTYMPEKTLNIPGVDIIFRGESEFQFLELINKIRDNKNYDGVKNICFKKDGKIIKNPLENLITELDKFPFIDRELFNYKEMMKVTHNRAEFIASRGCPYRCSYCYSNFYHKLYKKQNVVRFRSPKNIVDEIKLVKQKYNPSSILFQDDTFVYNKNWIKSFVIYIKKK